MTDRIPGFIVDRINIFLDGADLEAIRSAPFFIKGFTTNPSLMRKAGVMDYKAFCIEAARAANGKPISFEVFADDPAGMIAQAREIASWGENVYVKVPVVNSEGSSTDMVVAALSRSGIKVNVTAVMAREQIDGLVMSLSDTTPSIVSVFAGRVADIGSNPKRLIDRLRGFIAYRHRPAKVLWASVRETSNLFQAIDSGCDIITLTPAHVAKLSMFGRCGMDYSRETVEMFRRDALAAGYNIPLSGSAVA